MQDYIEKIIKCKSYEIKTKINDDESIFYYKDGIDEFIFKFDKYGNTICWSHRPANNKEEILI